MSARQAFDALLAEHAGLLARIASSYEADPGLREDLLQDIAIALWKALPGWRGQASVRTFIARIAHHRAVSHVVARARAAPTVELDAQMPATEGCGPEDHTRLDQERARLQDAVRRLPLALRQAVTLAMEGFSHQEIADALGSNANSVGVRLHRARAALAQALGETS